MQHKIEHNKFFKATELENQYILQPCCAQACHLLLLLCQPCQSSSCPSWLCSGASSPSAESSGQGPGHWKYFGETHDRIAAIQTVSPKNGETQKPCRRRVMEKSLAEKGSYKKYDPFSARLSAHSLMGKVLPKNGHTKCMTLFRRDFFVRPFFGNTFCMTLSRHDAVSRP